MDVACTDVGLEPAQGWIWHAKGFFPCCRARKNTACEVDEGLWPDSAQRHDAEAELTCLLYYIFPLWYTYKSIKANLL